MNGEPVDKYFGVSMSDWISRIPNELEMDAVGLWQLVRVGRGGYCLGDQDLRDFVRRGIIALLEKGAVPVRPSNVNNEFWRKDVSYGISPDEVSEKIIAEWERSGVDPDEDGLWFSVLDN